MFFMCWGISKPQVRHAAAALVRQLCKPPHLPVKCTPGYHALQDSSFLHFLALCFAGEPCQICKPLTSQVTCPPLQCCLPHFLAVCFAGRPCQLCWGQDVVPLCQLPAASQRIYQQADSQPGQQHRTGVQRWLACHTAAFIDDALQGVEHRQQCMVAPAADATPRLAAALWGATVSTWQTLQLMFFVCLLCAHALPAAGTCQ